MNIFCQTECQEEKEKMQSDHLAKQTSNSVIPQSNLTNFLQLANEIMQKEKKQLNLFKKALSTEQIDSHKKMIEIENQKIQQRLQRQQQHSGKSSSSSSSGSSSSSEESLDDSKNGKPIRKYRRKSNEVRGPPKKRGRKPKLKSDNVQQKQISQDSTVKKRKRRTKKQMEEYRAEREKNSRSMLQKINKDDQAKPQKSIDSVSKKKIKGDDSENNELKRESTQNKEDQFNKDESKQQNQSQPLIAQTASRETPENTEQKQISVKNNLQIESKVQCKNQNQNIKQKAKEAKKSTKQTHIPQNMTDLSIRRPINDNTGNKFQNLANKKWPSNIQQAIEQNKLLQAAISKENKLKIDSKVVVESFIFRTELIYQPGRNTYADYYEEKERDYRNWQSNRKRKHIKEKYDEDGDSNNAKQNENHHRSKFKRYRKIIDDQDKITKKSKRTKDKNDSIYPQVKLEQTQEKESDHAKK